MGSKGNWYLAAEISVILFEALGEHLPLSPFKGSRILVVDLQEPIYRFPHLPRQGEAHPFQGPSGEDAEPNLNLVQPGGMSRGMVEMDVRMPGKPTIGLGFMGLEVVQDDMNLLLGIGGDDLIQEEEEFSSAATGKVSCLGQAGSHFQGGKECGRSMVLIFMIIPRQGSAIGKAKPSLSPL